MGLLWQNGNNDDDSTTFLKYFARLKRVIQKRSAFVNTAKNADLYGGLAGNVFDMQQRTKTSIAAAKDIAFDGWK